jgi:hypothetical protein
LRKNSRCSAALTVRTKCKRLQARDRLRRRSCIVEEQRG